MTFDAITVGGGLAGSSFATALAGAGYRVLVLEQEIRFKDRVRGENILPWGVAAARRLGLVCDLVNAGGHQPRHWTTYMLGNPVSRRDLRVNTSHGEVSLNIYHPDMQETLLNRATATGVEVKRGARVVGIVAGTGRMPAVTFELDGKIQTVSARVVVGADGRASQVRQWGGFEVQRNPDLLMIAGLLIQGTDVPDDDIHLVFGPGCATLLAPLGGRRARTYYIYPGVTGRRGLSGKDKIRDFIQMCIAAGAAESWFAEAEAIGPLAEFEGADRWVESPVKNGVVLIGDAAASSDPSWGCGLSLTLLDVEHLANALCENSDWGMALDGYAKKHDEYYSALHRILGWMTELTWTPGPEADERRRRVFPRMIADPSGYPDSIGEGPFGPSNEQARKLVLGLN